MATVDGYNSHMAERKKRQRGKSIPNDRRRIAQRLVGERLGIERGWEDSALAPATFGDLPDFGEPKLSPEEASKIEAFIAKLIDLGCNRYVVYWCIQELLTDADRLRGGGGAMATREDMAGLSKRIQGAEELIRRYSKELLLVAEACPDEHPLRSGWETFPAPIPAETMHDLLDHLTWVKGLAEAWKSPNVNSLMKNKGLLYLLAYALLHSEERLEPKTGKKQQKPSTQPPPYRLARERANIVAEIAFAYRWKGTEEEDPRRHYDKSYSAEDLQDKLQDFCTEHPSLFKNMLSLLEALERNSTELPR